MGLSKHRIFWVFMVFVFCVFALCLDLCFGGEGHVHSHHCNHGHDHDHHHHHHHHEEHQQSHYLDKEMKFGSKLPEELAEEEDLKLFGFGIHHGHDDDHHHDHSHGASELSGVGLWINALGCSLLVSLASLVCLIILPIIFVQGKPSRAVVDSLALFGAGAMLGDAFLHQLPHAFGGGHSHSHDHLVEDGHHHDHKLGHSHAHSLKDLSVGLCVLAGIVVFLLVEKIVRYVEHNSGGHEVWGHGHHHHHGTNKKKFKDDEDEDDKHNGIESELSDEKVDGSVDGENLIQSESVLRKRNTTNTSKDDKTDLDIPNGSTTEVKSLIEKEHAQAPSNIVFGYLNLFSDGVHNFTDGMALGSAFLLYGSVGGWSRTLFLLAHELPQEVGDFGILVRSGFSVFKALFFNFLSALAALVGTAMALLWGQDPGQSSLIEGFTAGGFIYIAVAGVLAEMNSNSSPSVKSTVIQLISLISGMAIALCISLVE